MSDKEVPGRNPLAFSWNLYGFPSTFDSLSSQSPDLAAVEVKEKPPW